MKKFLDQIPFFAISKSAKNLFWNVGEKFKAAKNAISWKKFWLIWFHEFFCLDFFEFFGPLCGPHWLESLLAPVSQFLKFHGKKSFKDNICLAVYVVLWHWPPYVQVIYEFWSFAFFYPKLAAFWNFMGVLVVVPGHP